MDDETKKEIEAIKLGMANISEKLDIIQKGIDKDRDTYKALLFKILDVVVFIRPN